MYNKHKHNQSQKSSFATYNRSRSKSAFAQKKKLDTTLFVNKAEETTTNYQSDMLFVDFQLTDKLLRNITERGYAHPSEIQEKTIPYLLQNRDVIGTANTGTGKTAAFLIPLIEKMNKDHNQRTLIVTPTRELAMQIYDEYKLLSRGLNLEAALCIGGANMQRQEYSLRKNPHVVIGTPGRLIDLIKRKKLALALLNNIVLDEVDRMVDIGFIKDIKFLISLLPKKRQSLFFSATLSKKVDEILKEFVTDAVTISIKQQETSKNVTQDIIRISHNNKKVDILHDLLIQDGFHKVLIFGRTKHGIEKLTRELVDRGFKAVAIHGNKSQGQRQRALDMFKNNHAAILLATDVASRGLDIANVSHVINYDEPQTYDDYVHRIGRTGRGDKKGMALTFVER